MLETHLAEAARLTEGADGPHVALVARAKRRGVEGSGRIQRDTRVGPQFSGLQMVTLAEQGAEMDSFTVVHKSAVHRTYEEGMLRFNV